MQVADAVAQILKTEGVEYLFAYPLNAIIEAAAKIGIRPIIVRQERTGVHMADALSRLSSGQRIGVFCMQHGPGAENAFGAVAQAFAESVPIILLPQGYPRALINVPPNFNSFANYQNITKSCEQLILPQSVSDAMRRAFTQVRSGRPRPALVEFPNDIFDEPISEPLNYQPTQNLRTGPDLDAVKNVATALIEAQRPVIYAGQGIHYAQGWQALRELAELLEAPVTTSLEGKSTFPENHPLSLGSGGRAMPRAVHQFLTSADVIFGIGCSFGSTKYGLSFPKGKRYIHATIDAVDINKDVRSELALIGDARLVLEALNAELRERLRGKPRGRAERIAQEIKSINDDWLSQWMPKLTSDSVPLTPYRIIWDLLHTVDVATTIITHDAGNPRDQLSPFWQCTTPLSYIGWGKTTQLGYGFGLMMGAKLAKPDKLCINFWGDAAIGMTGMDFETAVRERIPILSILMNNFSMATELSLMQASTESYRTTDISGNYADMAKALGGYGERVVTPDQIVPAIKRGVQKTMEGIPALIEFITIKETALSIF